MPMLARNVRKQHLAIWAQAGLPSRPGQVAWLKLRRVEVLLARVDGSGYGKAQDRFYG